MTLSIFIKIHISHNYENKSTVDPRLWLFPYNHSGFFYVVVYKAVSFRELT